ncbi:acyloxyacyl hydrolase [uncultured Lutibacter sp.]|uniref:acyloxyacyl hydrolase n=1 Tax=uncultured Lutibacter sp. TaxID=437739 RepID=UPI00262E1041|nr:acyloxyacyl hydrolase [uncultured Lutibacter sp.]
MKKFLFLILFLSVYFGHCQSNSNYIQADYFYGNILKQNPDAAVLLQGHPTGLFLSYNKRTFGEEAWQEHYNYPDFGYSIGYQDYKSSILGKLYSVYAHYNFYFTNKTSKNQLILRTGIGLAYNTNPYNKVTNNKNTAFGSTINSSTYFKLYFQRERILNNLGVNAGLTFIHASNSNIKSPNSGMNVWAVTLGVNYDLDATSQSKTYIPSPLDKYFKQPIKYNFAIRGGINESEIIGTGVKPFFVLSVYADKRLNRKSAIQFGADLYISPILKDYYELNLTIPHTNLKETSDFSRIGIFVGHELFINKISIETQLGFYAKYPFEYGGRVYETLGIKRYINSKWFASLRLKAHAADAETVELGVGIRL